MEASSSAMHTVAHAGGAPALPGAGHPRADYPDLLQRVERVIDAAERTGDPVAVIRGVANLAVREFQAELGLSGGRIYERDGDEYAIRGTFGDAEPPIADLRIPDTYAPLELCLLRGIVHMSADDPRVDKTLETLLEVREFAALQVADGQFVLSFDIEPGMDVSAIYFSVAILRYGINQKLQHEVSSEVLEEARHIQAAILPRRSPHFGDFGIAGHSVPLDSFGGDFFDYFPISDRTLGIAIADVAGHGLPAALLVRDVSMGLRMGARRRFDSGRTVEYLNDIIHQSRLTSRFVSLFFGHLRRNGDLIYVNAGHPPPIHLKADGSWTLLVPNGPVIGPLPRASFAPATVHLSPGDRLALYTDGVTEALGTGRAEEFGTERLIECARTSGTAEEIAAGICSCLSRWTAAAPAQDDRSVVVVTRPARASSSWFHWPSVASRRTPY